MRITTILVGLALATTALFALAPTAEAKPYCTAGEGGACDDPNTVACAYTVDGAKCVRNPCDPRFCDPWWP